MTVRAAARGMFTAGDAGVRRGWTEDAARERSTVAVAAGGRGDGLNTKARRHEVAARRFFTGGDATRPVPMRWSSSIGISASMP